MNANVNTIENDDPDQTERPAVVYKEAPVPSKAKKAKTTKAKPSKAKKAAKKASGKSGKTKGILSGPAVLKEYAPEYQKGGKDGETKTAGGNQAIDCGDKLADKLRGKTLDEVYAQAAKVLKDEDDNAIGEATLRKQYKHLNVGMQRMNLGNRLRAVLFPKK